MTTTWFITGASRGMGRELVEQALERGDTVAATLRTVVGEAFAAHGRIDVVVSNAGYGVFGVAEDLDDDHADGMVATNPTASIQLARAAIPHLRALGGGHLMQMSSMGGHVTFPAFPLYHATKWGIEGFYDALTVEVEPFGIRTTLIEPGVVGTGFFDAATRVPVSEPYRGGPADAAPTTADDATDSPERVVAAIIRAADSDEPPHRLVLGSDAWGLITEALSRRLIEVSAQRDNAATADYA